MAPWLKHFPFYAVVSLALNFACLPQDSRTPPAAVFVNLTTGDLTQTLSSAATSDGWQIAIDRYLITFASSSTGTFNGSNCVSYSSGYYVRLISLTWTGTQRVRQFYGLGDCYFDVSPHPFSSDNLVLGQGVSALDVQRKQLAEAMYREGVPDNDPNAWRTRDRDAGMYVEGSATKGSVNKHFKWLFWNLFAYWPCESGHALLHLASEQQVNVELLARGEALFALSSDKSQLAFQEFADADTISGNNDGIISDAELASAKSGGRDSTLTKRIEQRLTQGLISSTSGIDCVNLDGGF